MTQEQKLGYHMLDEKMTLSNRSSASDMQGQIRYVR